MPRYNGGVRKNRETKQPSEAPNWLNVLGFGEPNQGDWAQVRAAQLGIVKRFAIVRLCISVLAACMILFALRSTMSGALLYSWYGITLLISGIVAFPNLKDRNWTSAIASPSDLHKETLRSILSASPWAAAGMLFGHKTSPEQMISMWTVITAVMAGTTLSLSSLPLATSAFLMICGTGLTGAMLLTGLPIIAMTAVAYTIALILACFASGRTFQLHRSAESQLAEKDEVVSLLLREFEDSGGDWMWQIDASKCLTHVSPRFAYALGVESDQIESKPFLQILAGESWEAGNFTAGLRALSEKLKNRENFSDLILPVQVGSETQWWELSASPRFDDAGIFMGFRGVGSDVTEAHRSADKINKMARFDTLTGLPNRLQVTEALGHAMAEADRWRTRCGFMMIDLDRFKAVNDTLGHPVGDRLLTRVAERLNSIMSDNELCGRLGGDEFAVVIKDATDHNRVSSLARKLIDTLSQPYEVDQHTLYIGASVGTAIGPRDGRAVETLIRSADLALYRSKDDGGGVFHAYEPQLHTHAEERRVVEIALRKALERDEFEVHYQPVVSAENGQIESFEALLRWTNPELGSVSPAKFIPVAEDARLIAPIGEWVLRTACKEATNWPSTVRVAVNVSAEQLTNTGFVTTVMQALTQSGLPAHRLELEVTESVFMREGATAVGVLEQILALGVRLALDDFGTGYSSLGYLSKTKFSTIKIDRSFVQGAAKNLPESIAIIRAVVALADSLGMATTAEGVETEAECQLITNLGCRKIQGYLFGRPMPSAEARRLFDDGQNRAVA
jgi:diguanylate cyclase (GGDEF)-like protein/PAS domain S-box-containing protein